MNPLYVYAAAVAVFFVLSVLVFKAFWRVAEPNEALIISGLRHNHVTDEVGPLLVARDGERRRRLLPEAQPGVEQRR